MSRFNLNLKLPVQVVPVWPGRRAYDSESFVSPPVTVHWQCQRRHWQAGPGGTVPLRPGWHWQAPHRQLAFVCRSVAVWRIMMSKLVL